MPLTKENAAGRRAVLVRLQDAIEPLGELAATDMGWLTQAEAKVFHTAVELLAWLEEYLTDGEG